MNHRIAKFELILERFFYIFYLKSIESSSVFFFLLLYQVYNIYFILHKIVSHQTEIVKQYYSFACYKESRSIITAEFQIIIWRNFTIQIITNYCCVRNKTFYYHSFKLFLCFWLIKKWKIGHARALRKSGKLVTKMTFAWRKIKNYILKLIIK